MLIELAAAGRHRQHIAKVFTLGDFEAAHRYMERGEHIGKFMMTP